LTFQVAVFASGRGSNFRVLADHPDRGTGPHLWEVALLVSDREDAPVLELARDRGIPSCIVPVSERSAHEVARETLAALEEAQIQIVLLAGYLRLIPPPVVEAFRGRMLNIHPALLPGFGGKGMYGSKVHEAVLAAGVRISGPTIHLVDERYDRGPILAQWPVPVLPGDTPASLATRVNQVEHELFPAVVDELARSLDEGRAPRPIPGTGDALRSHFSLTSTPDLP